MCPGTYNENARGKRRVRCYAARVLAQVASVPELAAALPRVAAVAHAGIAPTLQPGVFKDRTRPELRFDLIAVGRTAAFRSDARSWFARALNSCRALLVEVDPALRAELLAEQRRRAPAFGARRMSAEWLAIYERTRHPASGARVQTATAAFAVRKIGGPWT